MTKVSVIIPVYNAVKTIEKCVDSILSQSFKDTEIILINDGSKDNSLRIINKYKNFENVKIISQNNKGVAETRNIGIEQATGDYIMFVDNDDYIDIDYIETYYNSAIAGEYDIVIGGYKNKIEEKVTRTVRLKEDIFSKYIVMAPWAKIYKRSFLIDNKIKQLESNIGEDVYFNLFAYSYRPKIKIIDYVGYNWIINKESISHTSQVGLNSQIKIVDFIRKIYDMDFDADKELKDYYIIRYSIWYLLYSGKNANSEKFYNLYKEMFAWLKENLKYFSSNKYLNIVPEGEDHKIHFTVRMFMLIRKLSLVSLFSRIYCKG